MTIRAMADQLHKLSVGGYFNGEKFTKSELADYIRMTMRTYRSFVMEIALPDGRWLFEVLRVADGPSGFAYWIPDSREDEGRLYQKLLVQY